VQETGSIIVHSIPEPVEDDELEAAELADDELAEEGLEADELADVALLALVELALAPCAPPVALDVVPVASFPPEPDHEPIPVRAAAPMQPTATHASTPTVARNDIP
jgi:hypothetical protein